MGQSFNLIMNTEENKIKTIDIYSVNANQLMWKNLQNSCKSKSNLLN
jgi:hypothetical protein